MGPETKDVRVEAPKAPKTEVLAIKRGNVTITSTQRSPVIFTALEQISWPTGAGQINGIGKDRLSALGALEVSYTKLKEVLAVAG